MRPYRGLLISLAILVTGWLIACAAIGVVAMEMALHPGRSSFCGSPRKQSTSARSPQSLSNLSAGLSDGSRGMIRNHSIKPTNACFAD
jgi:hypothetical protein